MAADLDMLSLAVLAAFGVVSVTSIGFVVWIVLVERADAAAGRARIEVASALLRAVLQEATMREALVGLHVATSDADNIDAAIYSADNAAQWAARLFARFGGGEAQLGFDVERGEWTASVPLIEDGPLVCFSLPDIAADRPDLALYAAVELVVGDSVPIRCDADPGEVAVRYGDHGGWQAFAPCEACGGQWLETHLADADLLPIARHLAHEHLIAPGRGDDGDEPSEPRECPSCVAEHVRSSPVQPAHPFVWFDPSGGGWMLTQPMGEHGSICVPLGITSYFVNHGAVRAAANRSLEW